MSKDNIKTKGDVKASKDYQERKNKERQKILDNKLKVLNKKANDIKRGEFKKIVTDSFVQIFANNYGSNFDYNSLINSIKFSESQDKNNNIHFNYIFNENNVIFRGDARKDCKEFNENSYKDFITTEDQMSKDYLSLDYFENENEHLGFELEQSQQQKENESKSNSKILDGQFIPVNNNSERYGEFNRINKLEGYTPVSESKKKVSTLINNNLAKRNLNK